MCVQDAVVRVGTGLTYCWSELTVTVPGRGESRCCGPPARPERRILHGISGTAKPGQVTTEWFVVNTTSLGFNHRYKGSFSLRFEISKLNLHSFCLNLS